MTIGVQGDGVFGFRGLILGIQQLKHPRGTGKSILQLGHHTGDLVEGLGVLVGVAQEHAQLTDGDAAAHCIQRTHQTHAGIDDIVDKAGGRVGQAGEEDGFQAHRLQAAVHLIKGGKALGFVPERLHDLLPLDHLVDQRSLLAAHLALALEVAVAALCKKAGDYKAQRGDADHHQRDGNILPEHEQQGAKDGQKAGEQLGKAHQQTIGKGVHVCDHPAHDITGGVAVQIGQRQRLDLAQRFVAQIMTDREGDAVVADAQQPLCDRCRKRSEHDLHNDPRNGGKLHLPLAQHRIDGTAAQDGDIQLHRHADGRDQHAAHHLRGVGADLFQHAGEGRVALLRAEPVFGFCAHLCSSPFLNWLS